MDLAPYGPGDRGRETHRTNQCRRGQQSTDRRGRQRQHHRAQQIAWPSRSVSAFPWLARVTARNAWASMQTVTCRCHPTHLRTWYWSVRHDVAHVEW